MDRKTYLVLKSDENDFEAYFIRRIRESGGMACALYEKRGTSSVARKIWTHARLPFERVWYGEWRRLDLAAFDRIIVFDAIPGARMLRYIARRMKPGARLIYWIWNPLDQARRRRILKSARRRAELWTFDPGDAKRYALRLNRQFFFAPEALPEQGRAGVACVMKDKDRYGRIRQIERALRTMGVYTDLRVLRDAGKAYPPDERLLDAPMDYEPLLAFISGHQAVLDIRQSGQQGMSLRALEALFLGKKLLTDDPQILRDGLCGEGGALYLGQGWETKVADFLLAPYRMEPERLAAYTFEGWLQGFEERDG